MDSEREKTITMQLLRSRFDACLSQGQRAEAEVIIELAWKLDFKYLAAQMVMILEENTSLARHFPAK